VPNAVHASLRHSSETRAADDVTHSSVRQTSPLAQTPSVGTDTAGSSLGWANSGFGPLTVAHFNLDQVMPPGPRPTAAALRSECAE
jgi:hypothetical protein